MRRAFGKTIVKIAEKDPTVILLSGDVEQEMDEYKNKFPERDLREIIKTTVGNYLAYVVKTNSSHQHNIVIQGVPCPNIDTRNHTKKNIEELISVIKIFNCELRSKSKERGFKFLDVHKLTDRGDGFSDSAWHIDNHHLSPDGFLEAWREYNF